MDSTDDLFSEFEKALRFFGYDRICYSLLTDHPSSGLSSGHGVLRNYPESWMKYYTEKGYETCDPVSQYALISDRPFTWDFIEKRLPISEKQKKVMTDAKEAELLSGIATSIHGVNGEVAGVGLASSSGKIEVNSLLLARIHALMSQFHMAYEDLYQKKKNKDEIRLIHLTAREREILLWAAEGKSDNVIADILGVSYSTIRFHMNNAFKKLGANERVYAVTKAIRLGLILPSYVRTIPDDVVR